ncbi:MAG TPA: carboxypeptidase-like regulatory domain-containing protein [Arachidicoccus soli]|nr:carboxypeptidase-like regulatory domain-containing protein [Arachidicoccus soli]
MKLILLLITLSLSLFHNVQGQIINRPLKTLTGRVISETAKISLSGAILLLKKSGTQCITNKKGEFSIQLKTDNDTLLVKYLGYKSKTLIISDQQNPLLIILQKGNSKLHEIIVSTGYQKIPEERATGSFDFIDQNLIDQQVGTDVLSRLESIANGVMVDRSTNSDRMMIRGLSTIRGPKKPLIILNNFPYEGDISNINPNDVKSITILKDAAAASIWGTRAGNGVIVINTKDGSYNKPISIEVNTNITIGQKPDLSYLRIMSSQDFINVEKYLFSKGYYNSIENSSSYPPLSPAVELLIAERDGKISQSEMDEGIKSLANHSVYSDMNQYLYQEAVKQQYAISMKGGSLKNAWILSTGYDRNISDLDAKYNRLNLHLENKYKPITNLEIKAGLYITKTNTQEGKPTYNDIKTSSGSLPPYTRLADNNGNPIPFYMDYRQTYIDTVGDGKLLDWKYYPLEDYQYTSNKVNTLDLLVPELLNLNADWQNITLLHNQAAV